MNDSDLSAGEVGRECGWCGARFAEFAHWPDDGRGRCPTCNPRSIALLLDTDSYPVEVSCGGQNDCLWMRQGLRPCDEHAQRRFGKRQPRIVGGLPVEDVRDPDDACACFGPDRTCDESCLDRTGLAPGDADRACARCGVTPPVALIEAVKRAEAAENDAHDWMDRAVRAESELAEARAMHEGARIRYRYAEGLLESRQAAFDTWVRWERVVRPVLDAAIEVARASHVNTLPCGNFVDLQKAVDAYTEGMIDVE